jgi:hypothetical protein
VKGPLAPIGGSLRRSKGGARTPATQTQGHHGQSDDPHSPRNPGRQEQARDEIDGSFERHDCRVRYRADGQVRAMASIFRDRESLEAELAMEQEIRP